MGMSGTTPTMFDECWVYPNRSFFLKKLINRCPTAFFGSAKPCIRAPVSLTTTDGSAALVGSYLSVSSPYLGENNRPAIGRTPYSLKKSKSTWPHAKKVLLPPGTWTGVASCQAGRFSDTVDEQATAST